MTGTIDITPAAVICPHKTSLSVTNVAIATGKVFTLIDVNNRAIKNSFQEIIRQNIDIATKPGFVIGRIIFRSICQVLQPSIIADSSSSLGISLMNPDIIHTT